MEKSILILERELSYILERIRLIRRGNVKIDRGISLKEALAFKKDLEETLKLLKENL